MFKYLSLIFCFLSLFSLSLDSQELQEEIIDQEFSEAESVGTGEFDPEVEVLGEEDLDDLIPEDAEIIEDTLISEPETPTPSETTPQEAINEEVDLFEQDLDDSFVEKSLDESIEEPLSEESPEISEPSPVVQEEPQSPPTFIPSEEEAWSAETDSEQTPIGDDAYPAWAKQRESRDDKAQRLTNDPFQSGLKSVSKKGVYYYDVKESEQKHSVQLKMGPFSPNQLANSSGTTFETIYGDNSPLMFQIAYEWQVFDSLGKFGLVTSLGFYNASGNGRLGADASLGGVDISGYEALEEYTLFILPVSVGAIYRFQISEKFPIVPYVEGGGDIFGFLETRDDGDSTSYGMAPAWHVSGGLSLLLNHFDSRAIRRLDREMGVNNIWLTAEFRLTQALSSSYDFSSQVVSGGLLVEF